MAFTFPTHALTRHLPVSSQAIMSTERLPEGISDENRRVLRLLKVLSSVGRHVLQWVLKWGCKKDPNETIEEYLKNRKGMSNTVYKGKFDGMMRGRIQNDPSCESFDFRLTFACIRWTCDLPEDPEEWKEENDNLESLCTKVKNMRDGIIHGEQIKDAAAIHDKCKEITEVLEKIIKAAGNRFGIPDDEIKSKLKEIKQVSAIMKAPLGDFDLHELHKFREEQKKTIRDLLKNELSEQYKDKSKIDPASFVTGKESAIMKAPTGDSDPNVQKFREEQKKRLTEGIADEDRRVFRLFKVLCSEGRHVLQCVLKWGCKKDPNETIEEYLKKTKGDTFYKKRFSKEEKNKINKDPSCESFDVTLTYACIRWACDLSTISNEWKEGKENLESLCTKVKNMRNDIICHGEKINDDAAMYKTKEDITKVLEKIIKAAGNKFGIPDDEIKSKQKEINKQISAIMKAPLGDFDPDDVLKFREEQKETIQDIWRNELSEQYKDMSKLDPLSFLAGHERLRVNVKDVYNKLAVVCEDMNNTKEVEYEDLLKVKTEAGEKPAVFIVMGVAGSGKTTFVKRMLLDWVEGSTFFEGLDQYDMVFLTEGRRNISSYLDLIVDLLPTVSYKFDDKDLIRSVNQLKVLLIMDGFDELNKESEKLIRELCDQHIPASSSRLQLLITTRPSRISDLFTMLGTHTKILAKLRGISPDKRVEFVTNLHNEMVKEKLRTQDTQKLVEFLKMSEVRLGEHYHLPLNLTLLTYLWASDPSKVNAETTATGLYIALQELIESRLQARLQTQLGCVDLPKVKSEKLVDKILKTVYKLCLDALTANRVQLSDEDVETLTEKCEKLNVPFDEMTEAFLVVEEEWTSRGYKTVLTAPHKSILEFYAARYILTRIETSKEGLSGEVMDALMAHSSVRRTRDEILEFCKKLTEEDEKSLMNILRKMKITDSDWKKFENMFIHLTGLLAHYCPDVKAKYYEEIVRMLQDTFTYRKSRWLDLLVEAKCDDELARLIATVYKYHKLVIRDDHMKAALVMFKYLDATTPVQVIVENDTASIPHFDELMKQLSNRHCPVEVNFKHQWKSLQSGFSDDHLKSLLSAEDDSQRCRVSTFTGHLETLSCLPESIAEVKITLATTEHAKQILSELSDLVKRSGISYIGVHVAPEVMPDGLPSLPLLTERGECGTLWLSGVDKDWETRCKVLLALVPKGGKLNAIMLPRSNLDYNQCRKMLSLMKDRNIKVGNKGGIQFSSNSINKEQLSDLKMTARQYLGCAVYCSDESSMW